VTADTLGRMPGLPPVPRRDVLRGAGALTLGVVLGGCGERTTTTTSPASTTTGNPPAPPDWPALANQIGGHVALPADPDYATAKSVYNLRFDAATPAAVVTITSVDDLRRAMTFAAESALRVAARSGGHSYVGDSAMAGAVVLDLRPLGSSVAYDDGTQRVTVSPATDLATVQAELAAYGRSIPSGSCPSVGIAGLTLGGGVGADARRCGLTCDALESVSVVLPGGDAVTASADDHADLHWALRGGGGGHNGIVTSLTYRTFDAPDRDLVGLTFPGGAAADVLTGWHAWVTAADRDTWAMVTLSSSGGDVACRLTATTAAGGGDQLVQNLVTAIGVTPEVDTRRSFTHAQLASYLSGGDDARRPRAVLAGSDVLGEMSSATARSMVAAVAATTVPVSAVAESLSGAVGDVAADATAFPWRDGAINVQWYSEPTGADAAAGAARWLSAAHDAVRDHSIGRYVNYLEPDVPAATYFGPNLARLATVRQTYDPNSIIASSLSY
jgi:FAD/FMN-containing dehydrogenase